MFLHYIILFPQTNTKLKRCYPDSSVVKWFWTLVKEWDDEKRARLLQFVTGSSRVPLQVIITKMWVGAELRPTNETRCNRHEKNDWPGSSSSLLPLFSFHPLYLQGFKALQGSTGSNGPRLFTIHLVDASTDNLPKAHTCFNRIDIPPYESFDKFKEKLTCAVEETCGFAVEWPSCPSPSLILLRCRLSLPVLVQCIQAFSNQILFSSHQSSRGCRYSCHPCKSIRMNRLAAISLNFDALAALDQRDLADCFFPWEARSEFSFAAAVHRVIHLSVLVLPNLF